MPWQKKRKSSGNGSRGIRAQGVSGRGCKKFPGNSELELEFPVRRNNRKSRSPRAHKCSFCRGRFPVESKMREHVLKAHGYPCFHCLLCFQTSREAYFHWKTDHVPELQISEARRKGETPSYLSTRDGSKEFRALDLCSEEEERSGSRHPRKVRLPPPNHLSALLQSPVRRIKRSRKRQATVEAANNACPIMEINNEMVELTCGDVPEDLTFCEPVKMPETPAPLASYIDEVSESEKLSLYEMCIRVN